MALTYHMNMAMTNDVEMMTRGQLNKLVLLQSYCEKARFFRGRDESSDFSTPTTHLNICDEEELICAVITWWNPVNW